MACSLPEVAVSFMPPRKLGLRTTFLFDLGTDDAPFVTIVSVLLQILQPIFCPPAKPLRLLPSLFFSTQMGRSITPLIRDGIAEHLESILLPLVTNSTSCKQVIYPDWWAVEVRLGGICFFFFSSGESCTLNWLRISLGKEESPNYLGSG